MLSRTGPHAYRKSVDIERKTADIGKMRLVDGGIVVVPQAGNLEWGK
jgi:hypothetical protein